MARHDALTDLPNRVLLRERLEHELKRVKRGEMPGGALSRPRPLQERQRHARPSDRRRAAQGRGRSAARLHPRAGYDRAARRRRVRHHHDRRCSSRPMRRRWRERIRDSIVKPYPSRRSPDHRRHQHRHLGRADRRGDAGPAAEERRHGALRRQGRRARHLPVLRAGDGRAHEGAARSRDGSAQRARRTRSSSSTISRWSISRPTRSRRSRRCCAGIIPSAA